MSENRDSKPEPPKPVTPNPQPGTPIRKDPYPPMSPKQPSQSTGTPIPFSENRNLRK